MLEAVTTPRQVQLASWAITALILYLIVKLQLVAALFAGLLVFELVNVLAARMRIGNLAAGRAKMIAVAILAIIIVGALSIAVLSTLAFFRGSGESLSMLIRMMAEVIEGSREKLPEGLALYLPEDIDDLKLGTAAWLRDHVADLRLAGEAVVRKVAHILIGMVIGTLLALREALPDQAMGPLAMALEERADRFGFAFRNIVFAQVRIAALNAFLTGLYLGVALPLLGIQIPFTKTLVAVTFIAGLLPVIGNLISNTVIVVVSLSVSLEMALASLAFLVVIHKLEYFVNARIIGSRINARAWELLIAMLALESAFGMVGLVAAPVYYAYIKHELKAAGLV